MCFYTSVVSVFETLQGISLGYKRRRRYILSAILSALEFILLYLFGVFCILTMLFILCGIYIIFPGGDDCDEKINGDGPERIQKMEM